MDMRDLLSVGLIIVVSGIALGIGAQVLSSVQSSMTSGTTEYLAVGNATAGIGELAKWYPTIGLITAAAIIIGIVISAFAIKRRR